MIELRNLRKAFGSFVAVDGVSFNVERGEVLGFLGPNGAGKSTTMKMVTGFLTPTSGTAVVSGFDVTRSPLEVKRRTGYLPEGAPAYPDMTPESFLRFCCEVRGIKGQRRSGVIDEVSQRVRLKGVMRQPIETLSKGFKRRVGLAQALVHDPEILILDEPTDGLDPNQKHEVRELIRSLGKEKVIVLSTHILEEVEAVCTRAAIISNGRVVADATPAELQAMSPDHNSVLVRLGNIPEALESALRALPGVSEVRKSKESGGCAELQVIPLDGAMILESVSQLMRQRGVAFDGLRVEAGRLDRVFRQLTGDAHESIASVDAKDPAEVAA